MLNYRTLAVRALLKDQRPTSGLPQTPLEGGAQSKGSAFTKRRFAHLKAVSGRLTRLLLGRKKLVPKETAMLHLLVIDDEESIRFSMSEYFSRHGFTVDTARGLEEAAKLIETTTYQVVIQDLRLGFTHDSGGLEIIKLIHQKHPETRIVVLTSYGSAEVEVEARRSGADAFLHKPKPLSQVAQVVQGLVESPRKKAAPSS
jgi:ActR/RegA family two-component response regulator